MLEHYWKNHPENMKKRMKYGKELSRLNMGRGTRRRKIKQRFG
jgi:hypothetical protein